MSSDTMVTSSDEQIRAGGQNSGACATSNEQSTGTVLQPGPVPTEPDSPHSNKPRRGVGGTFSHSPNCKCRPCKARRRASEAVLGTIGSGGIAVDTTTPPKLNKLGRRIKACKGLKERVAQYRHLSMVHPNATKAEIAARMDIRRDTLWKLLRDAREAGIITYYDPIERIENEIIPQVVDNLSEFLAAKDKTVTLETAKGTIFKQFQAAHGINEQPSTVLALKIEMPDGQNAKIVTGHIVGRPKELLPIIEVDETQA